MKKIVVNENQEKNLLETLSLDNQIESLTPDEEERIEALGSFLDIIITRLEEVSRNLMEVQDFIEGDPYAKENVDKFKPFFDDIYNLIEKVGHIYDNMPTDI